MTPELLLRYFCASILMIFLFMGLAYLGIDLIAHYNDKLGD